jgi:transcriptional regulator with XRE-family HTH domain
MAELGEVLAKTVRALRIERGLTQPQLADLAGLSDTWIRRIEAGKVSPSLDTLAALASALQVEVTALLRSDRPATLPERIVDAVGSLDEEAVDWLLRGARLLRARRKL